MNDECSNKTDTLCRLSGRELQRFGLQQSEERPAKQRA